MRRSGLVIIFSLLFTSFVSSLKAGSIKVLTSIVPIHSLASMLLEGISDPELLLDGTVSAHVYSLKPSDIKKIQESDLIIYVADNYETFLHRLIVKHKKESIEVIKTPGLNLISDSSSCCMHAHEHDEHGAEHKHEHDGHYIDPHFWLSPSEMKAALVGLHKSLKKILPHKDHDKLDNNMQNALYDMDKLRDEVSKILSSVKGAPFMVFHDGYKYFARDFHMNYLGAVMSSLESGLSLKDRKNIFNIQKRYDNLCIFYESQFSPRILDKLQKQINIQVGKIDPIGINQRGKSAYREMMISLAKNLRVCLEK